MSKINEKDLKFLEKKLASRWFLVHFQGEWHSGITPYVQNWKVSGSNPIDALGAPTDTWNSVVINIEWLRLPPCQWPQVGLSAGKWMTKKIWRNFKFYFVFLLPFLTSKQISIVVLIVFQRRYPRTITIQTIRQLQWTDTKATSENFIISFLKNNKLQ